MQLSPFPYLVKCKFVQSFCEFFYLLFVGWKHIDSSNNPPIISCLPNLIRTFKLINQISRIFEDFDVSSSNFTTFTTFTTNFKISRMNNSRVIICTFRRPACKRCPLIEWTRWTWNRSLQKNRELRVREQNQIDTANRTTRNWFLSGRSTN